MSVIEFKRPTPKPTEEQWGTGEAFCIGCDHKWVAVERTGTTNLQCPKCLTMKGKWMFEFYPSADILVKTCQCGNQLFYMTKQGHMCANCGTYIQY